MVNTALAFHCFCAPNLALLRTAGRSGRWQFNSSLSPRPDADVMTDVLAITTGDTHTCALMISGGIRCWGGNYYGQVWCRPAVLGYTFFCYSCFVVRVASLEMVQV